MTKEEMRSRLLVDCEVLNAMAAKDENTKTSIVLSIIREDIKRVARYLEINPEDELGSNELKPCPFCGGEAKVVKAKSAARIYCTKCLMDTRMFYPTIFSDDVEKKAIETWNRRAKE